MAETLGMRSGFNQARVTGQTIGQFEQKSETRRDFVISQGHGYTPSIMSPMQHATGIGLNVGENTLYSMPSPLGHR